MLAINLKISECCSFDFTTFQKILKSLGSKEAERSRAEASGFHFGSGGLGFKSYRSQKIFQARKSWIFYDLIRMCGYMVAICINRQISLKASRMLRKLDLVSLAFMSQIGT